MEYIEVDGSRGEGGGQTLRSAAAFAAISGTPVRVTKIRAGRDPPGLKRQHVSALKVVARIFGGTLEGATEGSSSASFVPGSPRREPVSIDMGTAASITLVLQAVVPAVALGGAGIAIELVGGTDVPWSPTLDYFREVVCKGYASIGIRLAVDAPRRGYYPKGGGVVRATIAPCESVVPLTLDGERRVTHAALTSRCALLPVRVAERQLASAASQLEAAGITVAERHADVAEASSPGTSVLVCTAGGGALVGADAIGSRGKPAEDVGREAAERFVRAAKSGAAMDSNLADMVLPLLSLAPGPSRVRVPEVTPHLRTGLSLAEQFTGCKWSEEWGANSTVVEIVPGERGGRSPRHNV